MNSKVSRYLKGSDLEPHFAQELLDELQKFNQRTEALDNVQETTSLNATVIQLKKNISDLEIAKDRREHDFKLREQEIQHMVGLERKRSEFEREEAAKNARIEVREEALIAKEHSFDDNMKFMRERFEQEVNSMREVHNRMFDLVPKVTVDRQIKEEYKSLDAGAKEAKSRKKR